MSTALAQVQHGMSMWEDSQRIEEIRRLFAPKLSDSEFHFFVGLGKATGLNPFLREIWSVKYQENTPAQVFIGRDGYRKAAQSHPDYEWHEPDSIYENDLFEKLNGQISHKYNLKDRGKLIGAYCLVKRKSSTKPVCIRVSIEEYSTGKSLWNTKPETMIKKVAEAQALRLCFQDLLGGTYGEEELPPTPAVMRVVDGSTQTEKLKHLLQTETIDQTTGEVLPAALPPTSKQLVEIDMMLIEKNFDADRIKRALAYYKVKGFNELSEEQARMFLLELEKL